MPAEPTFELFHQVADPASARVRRFIVDAGLEEHVRFRNVVYPEVQADLRARGGGEPPLLWDGTRLIQGAEAILSRLRAHMDVGRAD